MSTFSLQIGQSMHTSAGMALVTQVSADTNSKTVQFLRVIRNIGNTSGRGVQSITLYDFEGNELGSVSAKGSQASLLRINIQILEGQQTPGWNQSEPNVAYFYVDETSIGLLYAGAKVVCESHGKMDAPANTFDCETYVNGLINLSKVSVIGNGTAEITTPFTIANFIA